MSSADPSLSLPHQSHTVPPAHPVPPSSLSLHGAVSIASHVPRSHHPSRGPAEETRCVIPFLVPCFSAVALFRVVPRQHHRPQLTLIYVIFSGRPHVTALRRTLEQRVLDVRAGYQGMRFADARASGHGKRERETRQKYRVTEPR